MEHILFIFYRRSSVIAGVFRLQNDDQAFSYPPYINWFLKDQKINDLSLQDSQSIIEKCSWFENMILTSYYDHPQLVSSTLGNIKKWKYRSKKYNPVKVVRVYQI